jgi:hypothetical protein
MGIDDQRRDIQASVANFEADRQLQAQLVPALGSALTDILKASIANSSAAGRYDVEFTVDAAGAHKVEVVRSADRLALWHLVVKPSQWDHVTLQPYTHRLGVDGSSLGTTTRVFPLSGAERTMRNFAPQAEAEIALNLESAPRSAPQSTGCALAAVACLSTFTALLYHLA